jgi:hypothetical protein
MIAVRIPWRLSSADILVGCVQAGCGYVSKGRQMKAKEFMIGVYLRLCDRDKQIILQQNLR